jgi:hypothetical protein
MALADHFEPGILPHPPWGPAAPDIQEQRVERWCRELPKILERFRDADGFGFRHTYFYPAEQYRKGLIDRLAEHCHRGWGEMEIHLHHGVRAPDTAQHTTELLTCFRDRLVGQKCLSTWEGRGPARYAFVHGNFALANSNGGRCCGVDNEMQVLADTGCYADFTLPAAPNGSQVAKINSIYECALPLCRRAPHRRGRDLRVGAAPTVLPVIVQGPLMLNFGRFFAGGVFPGIENSEVSSGLPATLSRLRLWMSAGIQVRGRPDWSFIKLHCHGMDPRDESAMFGAGMQTFLRDLTGFVAREGSYVLHFVTAREMFNIILAACDGREGNPADYRDYRLKLLISS